MIETFEITVPPLTGDRKRKAYVYLPVGYGDGDGAYPVMYMFDGQNLFDDGEATYGKSWGIADYLDFTRTPLIVAGVECDSVGDGRLSEYSPVPFCFHGKRLDGKGKKYMNWLVREFKPFVDANYRTLPDRRNTAIGGSSMGGLMTIYALSAYNRCFSRGAALSPSLWVGGEGVPEFVVRGRFSRDTVLYTDYGSKEFSNHTAQRKAFANTCAYLMESGVNVTCRIVPGGTHCEASWQKQVPFFMNVLGFLPEDEYGEE